MSHPTIEQRDVKMVSRNGYMLDNIPERDRTYRVCMAAVKDTGAALQYVPEEHKTLELCLAATREHYLEWCIDHIPEHLRSIVRALLKVAE